MNRLYRYVSHRKGNDVYYKASPEGKIKRCWLTTWQEWAVSAECVEKEFIRVRTRKTITINPRE